MIKLASHAILLVPRFSFHSKIFEKRQSVHIISEREKNKLG